MVTAAAAAASIPISVLCSARASSKKKKNINHYRIQVGGPLGNFGHFVQVVKKDVNFLKEGISKGIDWANEALHIPLKEGISKGVDWANEALHIPQVMEKVDHFVWLRNLENPNSNTFPLPSWPQPFYPELSGVDLYLADLKALEAYVSYFYYMSKMWTKPLPEVYDPQEVAYYFSCRPHIVAFRLLEVFSSFASAAIRIRISGTRKLISSNVDKDADKNISQYIFGMVLKETMLNLGPTFIKVGQSLSTRPDIIGYEISKALSELHDQIPPFPRTLAMKIIEEELGAPVETFFSYISEEAVAAASFGQVYKASTIDGYNVALKVQRPNLHHVVERDIYILRLGLGLLQKAAKRKSDLRLYADELGKGLVGELDYTLEAANALEFMEAHSPFHFIRVPKVLPHLSRKRVLVMEWMSGENPNDLISISNNVSIDNESTERQQNDAKRRLLDLVNKGVEACLVQLIETGLLHADPHPGNLRYISSGQIGFLDFGLICRMEKKHQFAMLASIVHIVNGDWASLVGALTEMDVVRPGTSTWRVTMDLEYALGEVDFNNGIPNIKFSRVLGKIWSVALKYHFRMPPYYTLMLRSLASLEGLAMAGDPNFKTFEAAYPYVVRKLLTDNSVASRRILHSVVLNKRKEFQWQKLAFFLRIGATRKGLHLASKSETSVDYFNGPADVFDAASLALRLILSKDGVVLRRLLMTADGASLVEAIVSKEAYSFRQQLCGIIVDVLHQWMCATSGQTNTTTRYSSRVRMTSGVETVHDYQSILRDRRLKVIFLKVLKSTRRNPILMLRLSWVSFLMLLKASALACHRMLVSLSEAYLGRLSLASKPFAESNTFPTEHSAVGPINNDIIPVQQEIVMDYTNLFTNHTHFSSREDLYDWVRGRGKEHGLVIVTSRSDSGTANRGPRLFLGCERGGHPRQSKVECHSSKVTKDDSKRERGSKKCGCPFRLRGIQLCDGVWELQVECGFHNHPATPHMHGHSFVGRLSEEEKAYVLDMSHANSRPKDILQGLHEKFENNKSSIKTIYNARKKNRIIERDGRSQMQQLVAKLMEHGYYYHHRRCEKTNTVQDLFFAHPMSVELLRAFPKVLFIDCTYKTNRYKLPLLEIVGVTSTHMTFLVGAAYMWSEVQDNYIWALTVLKTLMNQSSLPTVIVTDRDLALMNAIEVYLRDGHPLPPVPTTWDQNCTESAAAWKSLYMERRLSYSEPVGADRVVGGSESIHFEY